MLVIAHLTDIHIHSDLDPVLKRSELIGAAIASHLSSAEVLVIAVTGDIAYSGEDGQYDLALTFFKRIEERVAKDFAGTIKFVAAPGNHDCDFSKAQDLRNLVLKQIAENPAKEISPQLVQACVEPQNNFFNFLGHLTGQAVEGSNRLRYLAEVSVSGINVTFDCLNLSWTSQLHEEKITFPSTILPEHRAVEGCVVAVFHHPFNWLHPSAYRDFRRKVRANSDLIFSGHEHQWNVLETDDLEAGCCVQFEGNVLQEAKSDISGFTVVELDLHAKKYRTHGYQWSDVAYRRQEMGSWSAFRRFELVAPADSWIISKRFGMELSDLGVTLRVGGKAEVCLEDVFVFPDLEASSGDDEDVGVVQSDSLIQGEANTAGFVLQGDDCSGRTTLLKHLFKRYYDTRSIPLFVPSERISRATEDEIESLLDVLVQEQYDKRLDEYLQLPLAARVFLVDDFDEVPIKSDKARRQLLSRLRERCGVLVLSVSDVFEATFLAGPDDDKNYDQLPKYRVLPFGRLSRAKLISKWVTLDSDEFLDEDERIRRIDQATKYVEIVMRWNVVPRYPIYLLTLLQAQKAGSPESFKDSGLGYYYQYLISDAMMEAGIAKDKLTDVEQYCSQLAWWVKNLGRSYISIDELAQFNRAFSEKWVELDFSTVREKLIRSRIICLTGSVIEFRYSYVYYFFVAKYISENFDEPEAQDFVRIAAKQLYVRANANVLIFLTHFANKSTVIAAIVDTLNEQFKGMPVAQFALRDESVEAMLRQLPALVYGGGTPEENREKEARHADSHAKDVSDGLVERAEEADALSLPARITVVFKTIEILGQILKTQYSRIQRPQRESIIRDMLNGPLQALEVFYASLRKNPEALVAEFESQLAEQGGDQTPESRRALAQKVVGSIVLGITFGFVRKVAESVGAEAIAEDLRAVVRVDENLGRMLIHVATVLDGQRPLPRVEIERIRKVGAGSLIVDRVIQVLVVYHMYMFRTSYADIRWAHDVLGIPNRVKVRTMLSVGMEGVQSPPL